jgi:hypothetical protein
MTKKNFLPRILILRGMTFEFEYPGEFEFILESMYTRVGIRLFVLLSRHVILYECVVWMCRSMNAIWMLLIYIIWSNRIKKSLKRGIRGPGACFLWKKESPKSRASVPLRLAIYAKNYLVFYINSTGFDTVESLSCVHTLLSSCIYLGYRSKVHKLYPYFAGR